MDEDIKELRDKLVALFVLDVVLALLALALAAGALAENRVWAALAASIVVLAAVLGARKDLAMLRVILTKYPPRKKEKP